MLNPIYCVFSLVTNRFAYTGPSVDRTAMCLDPGTIYGWGDGVAEAREDVAVRAARFRGWTPLRTVGLVSPATLSHSTESEVT